MVAKLVYDAKAGEGFCDKEHPSPSLWLRLSIQWTLLVRGNLPASCVVPHVGAQQQNILDTSWMETSNQDT